MSRSQLVESLNVLAGMAKRNRRLKATFTFANSVLAIKVGSTAIEIYATGDWNGVATCSGQAFLIASRDLPEADPITIAIADGRLFIERRSVSCDWRENRPPRATTIH